MPPLRADSIGRILSRSSQPSLTPMVSVEGDPWVVKLVCGDTDERRWGPANELIAHLLLDLMGVAGRPEGALVKVTWPSDELGRLGAQGPLGFGWAGHPRSDLNPCEHPEGAAGLRA
jgi:hypothetical protein